MRLSIMLILPLPNMAVPLPKSTAPGDFFPTKPGTTRVYEVRSGDHVSVVTDTVLEVVAEYGVTRVTVKRERKGATAAAEEMAFEVSGKGVTRIAVDGNTPPDPTPLLKLPAKAGDTWEGEIPGSKGAAILMYRVVGVEEVEVPAGKFKALHVERVARVFGQESTIDYWHAAGVGIVKTVRGGLTEETTVLKSITSR